MCPSVIGCSSPSRFSFVCMFQSQKSTGCISITLNLLSSVPFFSFFLGNGLSWIPKLHPQGPGCPKCAGGEREDGEDRRFRPHQDHQGQRGILHGQGRKRQPCFLVSGEETEVRKALTLSQTRLRQLRSYC